MRLDFLWGPAPPPRLHLGYDRTSKDWVVFSFDDSHGAAFGKLSDKGVHFRRIWLLELRVLRHGHGALNLSSVELSDYLLD